jgi:hypothetical protein
MKKISRSVLALFVLASLLLGACAGAAASSSPAGSKVQASSVAYTGTIESINGSQWVVNGQTITVDPAVVKDGPFNVGDLVKVEVQVNADGSVTVTRIEVPSAGDLADLPDFGDDNSNDSNSNDNDDDNSNDDNSNDSNSNDANSNDDDGNSNDDNSNDTNSNDSNSNDNDDDNSNDDEDNDNDDSNDNSSNDNGGNFNG